MKRIFLVFLLSALLAGCAPEMPHVVHQPDMGQSPYCVLLVVDALGPDLLQISADNGDIPNIKKHILDRGMTARNMISVYPSITAGAITSILTGVFPGRHQIPNFTWVDRKTGKYRCYIGVDIVKFERDLYAHARTIFQFLPREESASFGFIQGRQAGMDESMVVSAMNPFHEKAPLDHLFFSDLFSKIGLGKGLPHLLAVYEWRVDVHGHRQGKYSKKVRDIMRHIDERFGKIVEAYQQRGLYDKTYFVLCSDHGLSDVRENFNIDQAFHNAGFTRKLISYNLGETLFPTSWHRADSLWMGKEKVTRYNAVLGCAGGGNATIDLVRNGGLDKNGKHDSELWQLQPVYDELLKYDLDYAPLAKSRYVNVIQFVRNMEPVELFIVRENRPAEKEPAKVLIVSQKSLARLTRRQGAARTYEYAYEVLEGKDPLGYAQDESIGPLVRSGYHDGDEWLRVTAEHAYPDAPVLFTSLFDTDRSGTLVLSLKPDWSVNSKVIGKHGGCNRDEMRATFAIAGPGLSRGEFFTARLVDITPTILTLLKEWPGQGWFDGRPIPDIVKKAGG